MKPTDPAAGAPLNQVCGLGSQMFGEDYFQRRHDPERQARRLVSQLEELGLTVTIAA
jgi:hypothetical protein